ncbi:MAG: hypothetical protein IJW43_05440 [Clostridia bacterium]|nr:hypothetical protein [Clostridia bacterium]
MTERLFLEDAYLVEFSAKVIESQFDGKYFNVVLDKTAFFPEGGGQKADGGFIEDLAVVDVVEKEDKIFHKLLGDLPIGKVVNCAIDFEKRFSYMQNHTGEHILSGIIKSNFGFNNVGFHLGEELVTLDVDGVLSEEQIIIAEKLANEIVYKNKEIIAYYPTLEEQENLDFRSKIAIKEGLRLVEIKDCDLCACCAPHVKSTAEVGNIKILNFASHRGGTRITLVCGEYLVNYLQKTDSVLNGVMKIFSANKESIFDKIALLREENQKLKGEIQDLKNQMVLSALQISESENLIFAKTKDADFDQIRFALNTLQEKGKAVLIVAENSGTILYILSSLDNRAESIFSEMRKSLIVKGGFRNNFSQGKIDNAIAEIESVVGKL